jgi:membrane associated rhomboid family serine protease
MLFPIKDYNPTRRTAYLTIVFIVINVAVFVYQSYISDKPLEYYVATSSMVPKEITHFDNVPVKVGYNKWGQEVYFSGREINPFLSIIASIFMHGSFMHLFGNMLFLWIFGNNIEDYLGGFRFIIFYFAVGVGASLIHVLFNFNSDIPVLGASGAVSGVMGAYLVLYPSARVKTLVFLFFFITFVDVPAFVFLIVWFIFQFFQGGGSGIAWLAHVGGFIIGFLLIKFMQRRPRIRPRKPKIEIIQ